jgi:hypothetical protein
MKGADTKIPARGRRCADCNAPLLPGHQVFSILELQGYVRRDLCEACFARAGDGRNQHQTYWRHRRPEPSMKELKVDLESVAELFQRLLDDTRPEVMGLRYLAALLLVRKRRLKLVHGQESEGQDLTVAVPGSEGNEPRALLLTAPDLSPESLERLKTEFLGSLQWTD